MFISRNLTYIFLGRVFFCPFLEHDPKPFPFGCACPTEGYFLMGPRPGSVGQWSGQGREGQGVPSSPKNHPPSPSPHPPPRVPIFLSARHRRRCSLQAVPRRQARPGRLGRHVDALPVSTACSCQLPPVQLAASCSGQDRRRNWRHQLICTTSYFSMFRHFNFYTSLPPKTHPHQSPCFYLL